MASGRQVLAAAGILVVAVAIVGAAGLGAAQNGSADGPDAEELTLSELREDGTQYTNSPDSVRIEGSQMYWLIHWPADAMSGNPGDPEDDSWQYLSPGATVDRNEVYLRTINVEDQKQVTVNVAYYNVETREVHNQAANTTTTEQYAANVTTETHQVDISRGWVMEEIPLRQSDEPRQVTMWVEGSDELRWTFTHHSVATTQDVPFSSWGGLLRWAAVTVLLPVGIGGVGALAGAKKIVQRTGVGPQWGYVSWTIVFGAAAFFGAMWFWGDLTSLLVRYPHVMALAVVSYLFVLMLETFDHNARRVRFELDHLTPSQMPSGGQGVDAMKSDERTLTLIDRDDEPIAVASKGLLPFLARLFGGGAARLRTVDPAHDDADMHGETDTWDDPLRCRVSVDQGGVDERVFIHPLVATTEGSSVVDYKPEGWEWRLPDLSSRDDLVEFGIKGGALLVGVWLVGSAAGPLTQLAVFAAGACALTLRPREGYCRAWVAPPHYRSGRATSLHMAEELSDAETIDQEREKRILSEVQTEQEIMDAVDKRDGTLIDGMFGIGEDEEHDPGDRKGGAASGDD